MLELKKIIPKVILLLIALIGLNYIYKATLWQTDVEYSKINGAIKSTKNADILYLGDCSDSYFGPGKDHEKGISQLLDSLLPHKKVATISETGFHAGFFSGILNSLPKKSTINTIVVTMNLRSFSANVLHAFTANSIQQRVTMLNNNPPLLNRFLLTFKPFKTYRGLEAKEVLLSLQKNDKIPLAPFKSLYDWKVAIENGRYTKPGMSRDLEKNELAIGYIRNYAFQIDLDKNPRIADFDQVVQIAKDKNIKLIFHLLPENINEANQLIGSDITNLINYNRNLLNQRYGTENITIIDNLELLDDTEFIETIPNSHFHYNGRKQMAIVLANFIN